MRRKLILLTGVVGLAFFAQVVRLSAEAKSPATRLSFQDRQNNSIRACANDARRGRPASNMRKVKDESTETIRAATPESLRKPNMIASRYCLVSIPGKGYPIFLTWMEDHPTLRAITIRNPETEKEITISIPQWRLDDGVKHEQPQVFIYGWIDYIPTDFVADASQALEVSTPGQKVPATCYPSVLLGNPETAPPPTTMPIPPGMN